MNMTVLRLIEIMVYEAFDLFPSLILAIVPFQRFMRFSPKKNILLVLFLYVSLCASRILAISSLPFATALSVIWIIFYLAFYFICIRAGMEKLLFVLLIILNYGSFIAILCSYFNYHQLAGMMDRPYSYAVSLLLFLFNLVIFPAMFFIMKFKIKPLIESPENNKYWRFLWLVPATFCLSYYYNLFSNGGIIEFSSKLSNVLFAIFFNLGALFVTYLTTHLIEESNANLQLKSRNYFLNMQSLQYDNLQNRIEDARQSRHNLRQILTVIQSYLRDDDRSGLLLYIRQYINSLPSESPITYCQNYALNAVIVYYQTLAEQNHIRFQAETEYPGETGIPDTDAVVLLGNLLENAVEACIRQTHGERFISLHIRKIKCMIVITLDNSFDGILRKSDESYLSSKTGRPGIGTASIRKLANKYNGKTAFTCLENEFHASVMLCTSETSDPAFCQVSGTSK